MHYDARSVHPFPVISNGRTLRPIPTPDMLVSSALGGKDKTSKDSSVILSGKTGLEFKVFSIWEVLGN